MTAENPAAVAAPPPSAEMPIRAAELVGAHSLATRHQAVSDPFSKALLAR